MKLLIVSDIHGSETAAIKDFNLFEKDNCDYLVLLGDVLYHGPRNPLPVGHNPKGVANALNAVKDKIISVRGNCDAEIDQMLLEFPCMADYVMLVDGDKKLFFTHGHHYSPDNLPNLYGLSYFFSGHTHVSGITRNQDLIICNPGSCALPKDGKAPSVALYDNGKLNILFHN